MPSIKSNARVQAQMETTLVASDATEQTGTLVTATTALNLDNGSIGLLSADLDGSPALGDFVTAANVGASTNEAVIFVQGTPNSATTQKVTPWEVDHQAYIASDIIHKDLVRNYKQTSFNSGTSNAVQLSATPTIVVDTTYGVYVRMKSVKNDVFYGDNDDVIFASYDTPASLSGITNATDKVLQEIAADINLRSKATIGTKDVVVLGIDTSGGAGVALGGISTAGTTIPVMVHDGITYNITSDAAMVRMLADQIGATSLAETSTIEPIDLSTAGDADNIDALLFVALPKEPFAIDDDVMSLMTVIDVNPSDGLDGEVTLSTTTPVTPTGLGRQWKIKNERRAQARIHTMQNHPHGEVYSDGITYVDESTNYGSYTVEFYNYEETLSGRGKYEMSVTILYPQVEDTETVTSAIANIGLTNPAVGVTNTVDISAHISTFESWVG